MPSLTHPFDPETLYVLDDDGNVRVTNGNSVGIFTREGIHISGDIRSADPQLCVWITNIPEPGATGRPGRPSTIPDVQSQED